MVNGSRARDRARVSVCAIALASVLLRENHLSFTISLDHPKAEGGHPQTRPGTNRTNSSNNSQLGERIVPPGRTANNRTERTVEQLCMCAQETDSDKCHVLHREYRFIYYLSF